MSNLDIQYLKGVGPKRAEKLERLGITTAEKLLGYYPRGYIDYSNPVSVAGAPYDVPCTVRAEVVEKSGGIRISGGRTMHKVACEDDGQSLQLVFFNNPYTAQKLQIGKEYLFYGKVGGGYLCREMLAPVFLPADGDKTLTAIYPLCEGLKNHEVVKAVVSALEFAKDIEEPLPQEILEKYSLPDRQNALRMIHCPKSMDEVAAARRRLIFEELLYLQLGLLIMRGGKQAKPAPRMSAIDMQSFYAHLPFTPTNAQVHAAKEICADMENETQMSRLLQGDVGSGKTVVAAAAVFMAAQNGYQSVLMAPTEILARQHAHTLENMLSPLGIEVALLTAAVKGKQRHVAIDAIASGKAKLAVGTHALIGEGVNFSNLGLAITDEQHRFGVRQRAHLAGKAVNPHLLVMSATPIPRTLALIVFGDLDISVIDELPPGRQSVKTRRVPQEKRDAMFGFLARQIAEGGQVYIVCPLIEEGESDLKAVTAYAEEVVCPMLPNARVGIVHGRLKAAQKNAVMDAFCKGEVDVLVSTTVIEVGVDVPNACVMVIEDAERYGLSALHQLRGRVGRGAKESWCFLVTGHKGQVAEERLSFLVHHKDGFEIAQYDMQTRGPGDFFGSRQHGLPALHIANLTTDTAAVTAAQNEAIELIKRDPKLKLAEHMLLAKQVEALFCESLVFN